MDKFVLINTGFTASGQSSENDCGKKVQLDESLLLNLRIFSKSLYLKKKTP